MESHIDHQLVLQPSVLHDMHSDIKSTNGTDAVDFAHLKSQLPTPFFEFEKSNYYYDVFHEWTMENRWITIPMGLAYWLLIAVGRQVMARRKPFSLRGPLAAWNVFMAVFSIAISVRTVPYFVTRMLTMPVYNQVCTYDFHDYTYLMWMCIFVLTKPIEFIDTLFIVLRKQQLHFLHYYHHMTVVIMCWYSFGVAQIPTMAIFYVAMNAFIHSVMYSYYCMRSARIHVPRTLQISITMMQILQMVVGSFINIAAFVYKMTGSKCAVFDESIFLGLAIYSSYLVLFANFFYKTYLAPKPNRQIVQQQAKKED